MGTTNLAGKLRVGALESVEPLGIKGQTVFDEVMTAEYTPDIYINPTYGLTDYRVLQTTANGGTIAEDAGSFRLRTGTTADGSAILETAENGDYSAGSMALAGILAWRSEAPTGNEVVRWGYYDGDNGFYFGEDATGFFVELRIGGSDQGRIYQKDMNGDPLNGKGDSKLTIDLSNPHVFRIRMALYGQGPAEMRVNMLDENNEVEYVTVHRFGASAKALLIQNWGLPVRAEADNGGDTTSIDLHVGGVQFGVIGRRVRKPRTTSETVLGKGSITETVIPVVSFQKKVGSEQINVRVNGFTPATSDDLYALIIRDGTLTDASFGSFSNISDSETALEVDTAATAISGGEAIYEDLITGGTGNKLNSPGRIQLGQSIPTGVPVTLAVRKISGTGGSGSFTFRAEEDW